MKSYFSHLIKISIFILLTLLIDRGLYGILVQGLRRMETGQISGGMINRARQSRADVIILGDSRAARHYDPSVLEKILHRRVYNAGCDGMMLNYGLGLMDLLLKDYTPELFIINVDPLSISMSSKPFLDRIKYLAAFMGESETLRRLIYDLGYQEPVKYLSLSFRFNGKVLPIIKNLFATDDSDSGFVPLQKVASAALLNREPASADPARRELYPYMIALLKDMIHRAKAAGARVVLANSPSWIADAALQKADEQLLRSIEELAESEDVPCISITRENTPLFRDPALFADRDHVNERGARIFSGLLGQRLAASAQPR